MLKDFGLAIAALGMSGVVVFATSERATAFGHTNIPVAAQPQDLTSDHRLVPADNYGVFRKSRMILVETGLAPAQIKMVHGQLMRQDTLLRAMALVHLYQPASADETKLWRHYFG